jgi:hypothetical protein
MQKNKVALLLTLVFIFSPYLQAADDFYAPGSFADELFGDIL